MHAIILSHYGEKQAQLDIWDWPFVYIVSESLVFPREVFAY